MKESNENKIAKATNLTEQEVAVIKATVAKNTTDLELSYFLMTAKTVGLSPFNKEIWCYKDGKGNLLVFAGRDGFLKIAQNSPRWNGILSSEVRINDPFEIDIPNGKIKHSIGISDRGEIVGAYAMVKPKGCDVATIEWVEFKTYDKGYNVWKSHPADMIKKVAEIRVLKKAFGIMGLNSEMEFDVINERAHPIDTESKPGSKEISYLERLIRNSVYDHDSQEIMLNKLSDISWSEYEYMKSDLFVNQLSEMDSGSYNQGDIKKQLEIIAP